MPARNFDGRRLRAERRAADLFQADIASGVGVSKPTVADWENGNAFPQPEKLPSIAAALRKHVDDLFPRYGDPDLADLRCDAGHTQRSAAEALGVSRGPLQNAERAKRRLDPKLLPRVAAVYGVTEAEVEAAQARSFGEFRPPAPSSAPALQHERLAQKINRLLATFPTPPLDEELAEAINETAGADVITAGQVAELRQGTRPTPEVLAGTPEVIVHEGLGKFFDVTPQFFLPVKDAEQQVLDIMALLAGEDETSRLALAARGGEGGLSDGFVNRLQELVAQMKQGQAPRAGDPKI
ncbi:helix-turn-helix transcriptional regulator [Streptomyces sp. NBC_01304]|uniref:helix-turn-helix transcriptional regulator n=1 Tax=Streptomyces sp. NBC_01304 TaxID=2903818 RepID=UPI002E0FD69D|nr:helix-turn-helix transcriptional regulator [Streptomyces sp. NBC_01304]